MAWTNPITWVAGNALTAAQLNTYVKDNLNFLRNGVANVTSSTSSASATSGTTELTVATSGSITFDGSTIVEVSYFAKNLLKTVGSDSFLLRLYDGSTIIAEAFLPATSATSYGSIYIRAARTPSAGAHTFTARIVRNSGTGTGTIEATSDAPRTLIVGQVT